MTNEMNQQQVHEAIDESLKHLHENPFLYERLQIQLEEEIVPVKKKMSVGVIVIAILLFLSMGAVIAASLGGFSSFNWNGEKVRESEHTTLEEENKDSYDLPAYQFKQELQNMNDFYKVVGTNSDIPIPKNLPEGYVFKICTLYYDCPGNGEETLMTGEKLQDKIMSKQFISGYSLCMINPQLESPDDIYLKSPLTFEVRMRNPSDPDSSAMTIPSTAAVHPVIVAGMEQALAVEYDKLPSRMLMMHSKMAEPITYKDNAGNSHDYGEYLVWVISEQGLISEEEMLQIQWKSGNR